MAANSFNVESETPEFGNISELASRIVYRLPSCDDMFVRRALRDYYVEFCRLANALVTERFISLEVGKAEYPIANLVPDCRIENVRSVRLMNHDLREGVDYSIRAFLSSPALSIHWRLLPRSENENRKIAVECLEMPNSGSERAPRWFLRKYGDAICAGALASLFSMTGRAWSDPVQARLELGKWEGNVTAARIGSVSGSPFGNGHIDTVDTSDIL